MGHICSAHLCCLGRTTDFLGRCTESRRRSRWHPGTFELLGQWPGYRKYHLWRNTRDSGCDPTKWPNIESDSGQRHPACDHSFQRIFRGTRGLCDLPWWLHSSLGLDIWCIECSSGVERVCSGRWLVGCLRDNAFLGDWEEELPLCVRQRGDVDKASGHRTASDLHGCDTWKSRKIGRGPWAARRLRWWCGQQRVWHCVLRGSGKKWGDLNKHTKHWFRRMFKIVKPHCGNQTICWGKSQWVIMKYIEILYTRYLRGSFWGPGPPWRCRIRLQMVWLKRQCFGNTWPKWAPWNSRRPESSWQQAGPTQLQLRVTTSLGTDRYLAESCIAIIAWTMNCINEHEMSTKVDQFSSVSKQWVARGCCTGPRWCSQ